MRSLTCFLACQRTYKTCKVHVTMAAVYFSWGRGTPDSTKFYMGATHGHLYPSQDYSNKTTTIHKVVIETEHTVQFQAI